MASLQTTNNQVSHKVGLADLPQELFDEILHLLPVENAINLLQTSRHLFDANWRRVYRKFINEDTDNRDFLCVWAAERGYINIIEFVLEEGLDVNALIRDVDDNWSLADTPNEEYGPGENYLTILHFAVAAEEFELSRWLIEEKGADPNMMSTGPTPPGTVISTAIFMNNELAMHLASFYKPEPFAWNSALKFAIQTGRSDIVQYLCEERGAGVNDARGWIGSPLVVAVEHGDRDMAELLLSLGANLNTIVRIEKRASTRRVHVKLTNAVMAAVRKSDEDMVQLLLDHGADLNAAIDAGGHSVLTPLCMTIYDHNLAGAGLVLKMGADPNLASGPLSWTPYGMALQKIPHMNHPTAAMLDVLIAHGANPNLRQWNQPPAVFVAMRFGVANADKRRIIHQVLSHGADPNEPLPQHLYSQFSLKPDPQFLREMRWTAMHDCLVHLRCHDRILIEHGQYKASMVAILLDHGADPLGLAKDVTKTPLGFFLRSVILFLTHLGPQGLKATEHEYNAMLSFLIHPRGAQSLLAFGTEVMARLLGALALLPSVCCRWFGPTQESHIQRFAEVTCLGERAAQSKDAWLATLVRHPGYWSYWHLSGRDSEVWMLLRQGAGKFAQEDWLEEAPNLPLEGPDSVQSTTGKRKRENEQPEQAMFNVHK